MSTSHIELIPIDKFNINNVEFSYPTEAPIKENGKQVGSYMRCDLKYKHKGDKVGPILLQAPKVFSFGLGEDYKFGKERTLDNVSGYKATYFLANPDKSNKDLVQTPEQVKFTQTLKLLNEKAIAHFKENADCFEGNLKVDAERGSIFKPIFANPTLMP